MKLSMSSNESLEVAQTFIKASWGASECFWGKKMHFNQECWNSLKSCPPAGVEISAVLGWFPTSGDHRIRNMPDEALLRPSNESSDRVVFENVWLYGVLMHEKYLYKSFSGPHPKPRPRAKDFKIISILTILSLWPPAPRPAGRPTPRPPGGAWSVLGVFPTF